MKTPQKKYCIGCPELGSTCENGRVFLAHSHEEAAEIWAFREDFDSCEYWIVQGEGATVEVKEDGSTDAPETLRVYGERSINYYAEEVLNRGR